MLCGQGIGCRVRAVLPSCRPRAVQDNILWHTFVFSHQCYLSTYPIHLHILQSIASHVSGQTGLFILSSHDAYCFLLFLLFLRTLSLSFLLSLPPSLPRRPYALARGMIVLVVIVVVVSLILFAILFVYLYRIHQQLKIRYRKPVPSDSLPDPGQHQELAFVLAHGVEAYNAQRRQQQQQQVRASPDNASVQSSHPSIPSIPSEPLPAYSPDPAHGEVGYGSRVAGHAHILMSTTHDTPSSMDVAPSTPVDTAMHPLDSLPPVYIQQAPSNRTPVQAALLSADNSPSIPAIPGNPPGAAIHPGRRSSRSAGSAVLAGRDIHRSVSMTSSSPDREPTSEPTPGHGDTETIEATLEAEPTIQS
ncbi:hypothetical protein B0O80DRAFT_122953 [Mortierella sp. GBAus27b]|nr:hypothetical protein B0O80DRAFT_122953 [Mortierella sp. GBAus27b]